MRHWCARERCRSEHRWKALRGNWKVDKVLIPHVDLALYVALGVVGFELLVISFLHYRYFQMSFLMSSLQVILGGALIFAACILIGSA